MTLGRVGSPGSEGKVGRPRGGAAVDGGVDGPALAAAKVPVLALFATLDTQVPSGSASARAKQAFATGGVADASVQVLEGLNHYMQRAVSGSTDEYADPNRTPFDKASTDAILAWLDAHFPSK